MADNLTRLESFPFDSKLDGYDDYGYPAYDRAVGAATLRSAFRQFFSNGIFGTPSSAFVMSKGTSLTVEVQPGMCIIDGAMGGIADEPLRLRLDTAAPAGKVAYGIMLRLDNNDDMRSLYVRVAKGEPGGTPPEPDRSSPGVYELRIGYVTVPNGATSLEGATITDSRGTDACPYAAPFEEIDVSGVIESVKQRALELVPEFESFLSGLRSRCGVEYADLIAYFERYRDLVKSALDGTTAGQLQGQIEELRGQMASFDLSGSVDDETIAFSPVGGSKSVLHLKRGFDVEGGFASAESLSDLAGTLADALYQFHSSQLDGIDSDVIVFWGFPSDVKASSGNYDSSGKSYYANAGGK